MREMKSSSNPWLHVPYGEWFTFAEHCLDNRQVRKHFHASRWKLRFDLQQMTTLKRSKLSKKSKDLIVLLSSQLPHNLTQAAAYLKKDTLGHKRKISPICKEKKNICEHYVYTNTYGTILCSNCKHDCFLHMSIVIATFIQYVFAMISGHVISLWCQSNSLCKGRHHIYGSCNQEV